MLITGTTEKIFQTKTHLYDVYVDNQNFTTQSPILKDLLKLSDGDRDKLQKLNNQRLVVSGRFRVRREGGWGKQAGEETGV